MTVLASAKIGFQESDWIRLTNQMLPRNWRSFRSFTCGPSYLYTHFHCGPLDVMMMVKAVQIVAVVLLLALSTSEGKKYKEGDCEGKLSRSLVGCVYCVSTENTQDSYCSRFGLPFLVLFSQYA